MLAIRCCARYTSINRWCAPEALSDHEFSHASDVWSFGVLAFEVFSDGGKPYADWKNAAVVVGVASGELRPARPPNCPTDVWGSSIEAAFAPRPQDRPSFKQIARALRRFRKTRPDFSDLDLDDDATAGVDRAGAAGTIFTDDVRLTIAPVPPTRRGISKQVDGYYGVISHVSGGPAPPAPARLAASPSEPEPEPEPESELTATEAAAADAPSPRRGTTVSETSYVDFDFDETDSGVVPLTRQESDAAARCNDRSPNCPDSAPRLPALPHPCATAADTAGPVGYRASPDMADPGVSEAAAFQPPDGPSAQASAPRPGGLSDEQMTVIDETWAMFMAPGRRGGGGISEFGTTFFDLLFAAHPEGRALFPTINDPVAFKKHTDQVIMTVTAVVSMLDDTDKLVSTVFALGKRHARYGVKPEYVPWAGDALVATISQLMNGTIPPAALAAFGAMLGIVVTTMVDGLEAGIAAAAATYITTHI